MGLNNSWRDLLSQRVSYIHKLFNQFDWYLTSVFKQQIGMHITSNEFPLRFMLSFCHSDEVCHIIKENNRRHIQGYSSIFFRGQEDFYVVVYPIVSHLCRCCPNNFTRFSQHDFNIYSAFHTQCHRTAYNLYNVNFSITLFTRIFAARSWNPMWR